MPKNVEDIVPSEKRSIRDIPIPEGRRKINLIDSIPSPVPRPSREAPTRPIQPDVVPRATVPTRSEPVRASDEPRITGAYKDFADVSRPVSPPPVRPVVPPPGMPKIKKSGNGKFGKRLGVVAVLILVAVVAVGALTLMAGATLTYTPKTAGVSFNNDTYTAYKSADPDSGKLLFSVVELTGDKTATVPASGQVQVSDKASGRIVVYNNYSSNTETLIKNTRFETTDGKIFRTPSAVAIPGKHIENGATVPGSVEIKVVADQPGADYNIGLSDFTVPGLKGDPRYTGIYGRSKTPMVGGLVGMKASVSDADMANAKSTLETGIKADLLEKARAQVPADYLLLSGLVSITYDMLPNGSSTDTTITVGERGNFSGVMFKKSDLAAFLASAKVQGASGSVTLPNVESLDASFTSTVTPELLQADNISFSLSGSTTVEWVVDEKSLAADLAGKQKSELNTILKNYPAIENASAVVRPFWKSSFPSDQGKIKIVKNG